jgi:hypothetical protein
MRNGYALCTHDGLNLIARHLDSVDPQEFDRLIGMLSIGIHWDVEFTDSVSKPIPLVSQAFCLTLPVAYSLFQPPIGGRSHHSSWRQQPTKPRCGPRSSIHNVDIPTSSCSQALVVQHSGMAKNGSAMPSAGRYYVCRNRYRGEARELRDACVMDA